MSWEWSDVRFFLAVAREGTTLGAARRLGMNQTTCARRIDALERSLAVTLFERLPTGYRITDAARELLPAAEAMEAAAGAFADGIGSIRRNSGNVIRVTANEAFMEPIVAPAVAAFRSRHPECRVDIDLSQRLLDLSRGEADIALRAGAAPSDPTLVGRRLAVVRLGFYCNTAYAAANGAPTGLDALGGHPIAALEGRFHDWLRSKGLEHQVVQVVSTLTALIAAVHTGSCVAPLPTLLGNLEPRLHYCFGLPEVDTGLWLLYPERIRGRSDIRDFCRTLADRTATLQKAAFNWPAPAAAAGATASAEPGA